MRLKRENFEPIDGFIAKMEGENVIDIVPDPALPDSALSYFWYGFAAHPSGTQWMQFTVNKGMVSATLSADRKRYSIGVSNNGVQLALRRFDPSKFPGDLDVEESRDRSFAPLLSNALIAKKRTAEQSQIPIVTATSPINGVEMPAGPKEFRNIDVLVLYTARALNRAGGDAPLGTAIVDSINQANQALRNSGINTFAFRRVLPAELSSQVNYDEVFSATNLMLNPSCTLAPRNCALVSHRMWVRRESNLPNGQINSLRAAANADLVVLMYETQDSLAGTGAAYLQKLDCGSFPAGGESAPGCDRGLAYRDFSFSVVGIQSTTLDFVFAHETGHQLGMEHNSRNAGANPSFPWSYAHYVSGKAQTILSGAKSAIAASFTVNVGMRTIDVFRSPRIQPCRYIIEIFDDGPNSLSAGIGLILDRSLPPGETITCFANLGVYQEAPPLFTQDFFAVAPNNNDPNFSNNRKTITIRTRAILPVITSVPISSISYVLMGLALLGFGAFVVRRQ